MSIDSEQQSEIEAARENASTTCRPTVAKLEERMFQPIQCLDHGFVRLIDYMGDDGSIVQAARVSYGKGTKTVRQDRGLLRYLLRHRHTTPFEMCEIKLHVKLPIFVARQWIRCGTLAGQPQNAVLRAGDLWLLLRNCKPNFVLAAGYRVRAASCAHRGLPALFASVRRTSGHKRLSACAHGMPSNLSRPSRELLSSLAAKNFCCCCCKK